MVATTGIRCVTSLEWLHHRVLSTDSKVRTTYYLILPCESTAEEVSCDWSHRRISSTESRDRSTY